MARAPGTWRTGGLPWRVQFFRSSSNLTQPAPQPFSPLWYRCWAFILANRLVDARDRQYACACPNSALVVGRRGTAAFLALVLLVPAVQGLFHFAPLGAGEMAPQASGLAAACILWFELLKLSKWAKPGLSGKSCATPLGSNVVGKCRLVVTRCTW